MQKLEWISEFRLKKKKNIFFSSKQWIWSLTFSTKFPFTSIEYENVDLEKRYEASADRNCQKSLNNNGEVN